MTYICNLLNLFKCIRRNYAGIPGFDATKPSNWFITQPFSPAWIQGCQMENKYRSYKEIIKTTDVNGLKFSKLSQSKYQICNTYFFGLCLINTIW